MRTVHWPIALSPCSRHPTKRAHSSSDRLKATVACPSQHVLRPDYSIALKHVYLVPYKRFVSRGSARYRAAGRGPWGAPSDTTRSKSPRCTNQHCDPACPGGTSERTTPYIASDATRMSNAGAGVAAAAGVAVGAGAGVAAKAGRNHRSWDATEASASERRSLKVQAEVILCLRYPTFQSNLLWNGLSVLSIFSRIDSSYVSKDRCPSTSHEHAGDLGVGRIAEVMS